MTLAPPEPKLRFVNDPANNRVLVHVDIIDRTPAGHAVEVARTDRSHGVDHDVFTPLDLKDYPWTLDRSWEDAYHRIVFLFRYTKGDKASAIVSREIYTQDLWEQLRLAVEVYNATH